MRNRSVKSRVTLYSGTVLFARRDSNNCMLCCTTLEVAENLNLNLLFNKLIESP